MEGPLWRLQISSRSVYIHGWHWQFLFLVGWFLKIFSVTTLPNKAIFYREQSRNKNCLRRLCLFTDRDHKSYLYGGRSRDASYQVQVHLAKQFQMRSFIEIYQPETRITNIAASGNSCFCFVDFWKSSPLGQMNRNLVGSIYGRSSIKIANFVPIRLYTWLALAILLDRWRPSA
jgi:hypothetical protein